MLTCVVTGHEGRDSEGDSVGPARDAAGGGRQPGEECSGAGGTARFYVL